MSNLNFRVDNLDAKTFIKTCDNVNLWLTDPPYFGIVKEDWDNKWSSTKDFCNWFTDLASDMFDKTAEDGSLVFFCGIGPSSQNAADLLIAMRETQWHFRNWLTWSKRRGFGKSHDYICTREEILWYSKSPERKSVTFNKPFTNIKSEFVKTTAGGLNPNAFKRCTTVWADLPEPLGTKKSGHPTEKPKNVMDRLVTTHSKPFDTIVDPFCGSGATGLSALSNDRNVILNDIEPKWADYAKNSLGELTNKFEIKA